jgi:hypothetical protein
VKDESDQPERTNQVRVEVKSFASLRLLQLADIVHVQDQMRAITERLGNAVVKIGEETKPDSAPSNNGSQDGRGEEESRDGTIGEPDGSVEN